MLVDSHCHLADEAFAADLGAVVSRAQAAGLSTALCILSPDDESEIGRAGLVKQTWPAVRFSVGVHPHRAGAYAGRIQDAVTITRTQAGSLEAVAIGEIGLDYHYDFAPRDVQRDVFAAQVALAVELNRPVVIHMRLSTDDTIAVLKETGAGRVRGVMHCFSGSAAEARLALDLGFYISLSGILTFPKAGELRETARLVPRDRLLVETDAPFLAPVPHRGQRNEPAWVAETLDVLAGTHGIARDDMAAQISANYAAFLRAPQG